MKVPILELKPAYEELAPELDAAYRRVMSSGHYLLGPELEAFEAEYGELGRSASPSRAPSSSSPSCSS